MNVSILSPEFAAQQAILHQEMQANVDRLFAGLTFIKAGQKRINGLRQQGEIMHQEQEACLKVTLQRLDSTKSMADTTNRWNPNDYQISTEQYRKNWGRK